MTADEYVRNVIRKHELPIQIDQATNAYIIAPVRSLISNWAGNYLCDVKISGSRAKGTAIDLSSDLDLFISLSSSLNMPLGEIYNSLYNEVADAGISARKQNVSIRISFKGKKIDLVPAKRQGQYGSDHSLYKRKTNTWTKTNIDTHISKVLHSGRRNEIIALKIWRENHALEFPSIFLEAFTIDALSKRRTYTLADNFLHVLECVRDNIENAHVLDPANSSNVISDDLSRQEKSMLAQQAEKSLSEQNWMDIIW